MRRGKIHDRRCGIISEKDEFEIHRTKTLRQISHTPKLSLQRVELDVIFRWFWMMNLWWAGCALVIGWAVLPEECYAAVAGNSAGSGPRDPAGRQGGAVIGHLRGSVADPSGAKIAHAKVRVSGRTLHREVRTNGIGEFDLALPPGLYRIAIEAPGFREYRAGIELSERSMDARVNVRLEIATRAEEITVPAERGESAAAADNMSALRFKGSQLNGFSDDEDVFQQEIKALAGGEGLRAPEILVNGFSNGRFPPKNTIQEIRINQNPYSAEYDSLGFGRVEIDTKPGRGKLHGELSSWGTDNVFNAQNPYTTVEPPYYTANLDGNLSGSVNRKTSFFLSGAYYDLQNNAIVDAIDPELLTPLDEAVRSPTVTQTYSGQLNRQVTKSNTFMGRYEYNAVTVTNNGVGLLVLPSEGLNSTTSTNTLQLIDTQIIGVSTISEAHFQFARVHENQSPASTEASIVAQGLFNAGGSPAQELVDNQDRYEFQELLTSQHGVHYLRFGGRYRLLDRSNENRTGYNGLYMFPDQRTYALALQGQTPAQIFAGTGETIQYNLTTGKAEASLLMGDLGVFAEDEWKIRKNMTLDLGFRFESQSAVPDHADPAPRIGFAWAVGQNSHRHALLMLRGGGGFFYDRFDSANILTAIREQSGTYQTSYYVENPNFYQQYLNTPPPTSLLGTTPPTLYNINPHLRNEYDIVGGLTAERSLGKIGSLSVEYYFIRGVHQWLSRNINAPLPGTYNPADPSSGVRPLGGTQNIYQFDSGGIQKAEILFVNSQFQFSRRITGFVAYSFNHVDQDVGGATTFPSNQYDLTQDYGRAAQPTQQTFAQVKIIFPFGFSGFLFANAAGGTPFNITTGADLNGDTIYNDRPAFATSPTANSIIYKTPFGTFDANPQPGEQTIPIDYGNSPNFFFIEAHLGKEFKIGSRPALGDRRPGHPSARPYSLSFGVDAYNLLNRNNPGLPVGVLSSPYFGQSISLNSPLAVSGVSTSANRTVTLHCMFSF